VTENIHALISNSMNGFESNKWKKLLN